MQNLQSLFGLVIRRPISFASVDKKRSLDRNRGCLARFNSKTLRLLPCRGKSPCARSTRAGRPLYPPTCKCKRGSKLELSWSSPSWLPPRLSRSPKVLPPPNGGVPGRVLFRPVSGLGLNCGYLSYFSMISYCSAFLCLFFVVCSCSVRLSDNQDPVCFALPQNH